jgi:hypothetical protein
MSQAVRMLPDFVPPSIKTSKRDETRPKNLEKLFPDNTDSKVIIQKLQVVQVNCTGELSFSLHNFECPFIGPGDDLYDVIAVRSSLVE